MTEVIDEFLGLEFSIDGSEDTSLTNGESAFILYLKIDNKTQKSRKINLLKATYITSQREQLEQDIWISGYIIGKDTLKANSFKKAGLVFYKSKLKAISDKDVIYISLELTQEGVELNLSFQKTGNNWLLISKEKTDTEIKLAPKQLEKNLLNRIERLEAFEERLGVSYQNISIKIDNEQNWFTLFYELHSKTGTTLNEHLYIHCTLYDKDGLIITEDSGIISCKTFFGFQVIKTRFQQDGIAKDVSKIRIYPSKYD